jgi:hypothetical protein
MHLFEASYGAYVKLAESANAQDSIKPYAFVGSRARTACTNDVRSEAAAKPNCDGDIFRGLPRAYYHDEAPMWAR